MAVDIDYLSREYFCFDVPVPFKLTDGKELYIKPISLRNSEIFLSSVDLLMKDKDAIPDVNIIQMSYLNFIYKILLRDSQYGKINIQKFVNILILCLGLEKSRIIYENKKPFIYDAKTGIKINQKEFDDIKRIILYQNILHYDDEYINPELKKAMNEADDLKNRGKVVPSLERKMAIISAHTGILKKEQQEMSYRSHCLLFEEVCGEVEFSTVRPAALLGGDNLEHWIFKKEKGKFDDYIKSVESYKKDVGGAQAFKTTNTSVSDSYMQQYNNFNVK